MGALVHTHTAVSGVRGAWRKKTWGHWKREGIHHGRSDGRGIGINVHGKSSLIVL